MVAIVLMITVVVMILMIPVSLVVAPAAVVMIPVRMAPIRSGVWPAIPASVDPAVVISVRSPVAFNPDEAGTRRRAWLFIAKRRRWSADVNRYLRRCGKGEGSCHQQAGDPGNSQGTSPFRLAFVEMQPPGEFAGVLLRRGEKTARNSLAGLKLLTYQTNLPGSTTTAVP
jgi:hypothetical protein